MSLITLTNISKTYQVGARTLTALHDVNLEIHRSTLTAIVGASGSGKSTLMNIIGFLDQCTRGEYYFAGENVSSLSSNELAKIRNQKIGFVFQTFFLLPRQNALQNVMLPLFYQNKDEQVAKEIAEQMLDKVGILHLADHKPNQLSGGEQQRVAIARALVNHPDIILADEPTGALDSHTSDDVMNLFIKLHHEDQRTILIITHDKEVSARCERVMKIKDGSIVAE